MVRPVPPLFIEWNIGESEIKYDMGGGVYVLPYECEQLRISGPWDLMGCTYEPSFLYEFDKWWDWKVYNTLPLRPYRIGDTVLADKYIPGVEGTLICTSGQYVSDYASDSRDGKVEFILKV